MYIATLNSNTLDASKIHYVLTNKDSKDAIVEGVLSSADNGVIDFNDAEKTELNTGLKGTYGSIYKIHNANITLKGNKQYDLYLFVDESVTNETMGQTFKAGVAVKSYDRQKVMASNICLNGQTLVDCVTELGSYGPLETSIYYHDSGLTNGAGDNSYRYAGGDYVLTEAGREKGVTILIGYDEKVATSLIDFYCNGTKKYVGYGSNSCNTYYYQIKGDATQYQTYSDALSKAVEKGYLIKDNVKNFACFGSNASVCPTQNLYRIIGVLDDKVKLIKYDYVKSNLLGTDGDFSQEYSYYWSGELGENPSSNSLYFWNKATSTNTWSESLLNKTNLNTNYINNIGMTWVSKIATTAWKVGGNIYASIATSTPKIAYQNEIINPVENITYNAKIGLMYVTDYYFGANPSAWTLVGYNSDYSNSYASVKGENWLYAGGWDWTISRVSNVSGNAFRIADNGLIGNRYVNSDYRGICPVFNLESSVTYVSGDGIMSNPIRLGD